MIGTDTDAHSAATIGSANLAKQISQVRESKSVKLSDFSHREERREKYFKHKLGGLGQYYFGVFSELNIMDGSTGSGIKNTTQRGTVIAQAMDNCVNRSLFLKTLEEDTVSAERLDTLSELCPCRLSSNIKEHSLLCDLFFVKGLFADLNMLPRRHSLQVILYLADELGKLEVPIDLEQFRGCTYTGSLPNGEPWELPERLKQNRIHWAIYQRNELLSLAIQGIFYVLLDTYQKSGLRFDSVDNLGRWFLSTREIGRLGNLFHLDAKVEDLEKKSSEWLPQIGDWTHKNHEIQLAKQLSILCRQNKSVENRSVIIQSALKVLIALKVRPETQEGYGDIVFPVNYFHVYPINLKSFLENSKKGWKDFTVIEWISWLITHWGVNTHLKVALRKLRGQSQSTFRIRPSDQGLEVISIPESVFTSPRYNQSARILKDIRALVGQKNYWVTSDLGRRLKEMADD